MSSFPFWLLIAFSGYASFLSKGRNACQPLSAVIIVVSGDYLLSAVTYTSVEAMIYSSQAPKKLTHLYAVMSSYLHM
jgi:hypothetical protein